MTLTQPLINYTAWKISKYGPGKTLFLDTFHDMLMGFTSTTLIKVLESISNRFTNLFFLLCLTVLSQALHKKWSFPLRISSVSVIKSIFHSGRWTYQFPRYDSRILYRKEWKKQNHQILGLCSFKFFHSCFSIYTFWAWR